MTAAYLSRASTLAYRYSLPAVFSAMIAMSTSAWAQNNLPSSSALQSCSVNDGVCQIDSYAGWFVGPAPDARIQQFTAEAEKPSVAVENLMAADGKTTIVVFKGANGKYLAVEPEKNWEVNFIATAATDPAAQFIALSGLDSPEGQDFTSFTPLSAPDRFLRHQGYKLYAHPKVDTSLFRRDASWRVLNATQINSEDASQPVAKVSAAPGDGIFYPTSHGDVHIRSMDGLNFDYQGAGDHLLLQSTDGEVVIQARQEMWAANPRVSVNRAGAMLVIDDKIEWYALPEPALYINGELTALQTEPLLLPGGGSIHFSQSGNKKTLMVYWPDELPVGRMQMY